MHLSTFLVLVASTFSFKGGSESMFVAAISEQTKEPVVYVRDDNVSTYLRMEFEYMDHGDLRQKLDARTAADVAGDQGFVFHPRWLPKSAYYRALNLPMPEASRLKEDSEIKLIAKEGYISVVGADTKEITVGDLTELQLEKPLNIHWFYRTMPLIVAARNVEVGRFLKMVAASVGARFEEKGEYRLVFEGEEFRKRAILTLSQPLKGEDARFTADRLFALEAVKAARPDELFDAYASPDGAIDIDLPISPAVKDAIRRRIEVRFGGEKLGQPLHPTAMAVRQRLYDDVDPDKNPVAELRSNGMVLTKLPLRLPNQYIAF